MAVIVLLQNTLLSNLHFVNITIRMFISTFLKKKEKEMNKSCQQTEIEHQSCQQTKIEHENCQHVKIDYYSLQVILSSLMTGTWQLRFPEF